MIDIHTHLIPIIDDGSRDTETSLKMVKAMCENGTTAAICTPHYRKPFLKTAEEVKVHFADFKRKVEESGLNINLYLGQEVYCKNDYRELIKDKKVLTLAGSKFILLEFDFNNRAEIADIVYEVKRMGLIPVIAHVERYPYLNIDDIYEIKKLGGFIQVNSDSVLGGNGNGVKKIVKGLFKEGFVDFVASDVHSTRTNSLKKAYEYVKRKYGEDAAEVVFNENAKRILKG